MAKKKSKKKKPAKALQKAVENLYSVMREENLSEISWEEDSGFELYVKRKTAAPAPAIASPNAKEQKEEKKESSEVKDYIRSPMNGVFYRAPSPSAQAFVEEGQEITQGTTVCIIEAMKLMNEVQVERHCMIKKVLAENGSAVKVNDPLFEVKPH